jgi:hypothetical protein
VLQSQSRIILKPDTEKKRDAAPSVPAPNLMFNMEGFLKLSESQAVHYFSQSHAHKMLLKKLLQNYRFFWDFAIF